MDEWVEICGWPRGWRSLRDLDTSKCECRVWLTFEPGAEQGQAETGPGGIFQPGRLRPTLTGTSEREPMTQEGKDERPQGGARIDDDEMTDTDPPLPDEGHDDPLTANEPSALDERRDPDTGLPAGREAFR